MNPKLRPLCLPALVEERTRDSPTIGMRSSMSVLRDGKAQWHNCSFSPDRIYGPFRLAHSRSFHAPAMTINSPPSPDPPTWSPTSQSLSPPDSPTLRTPRVGSGIVYFSTKNPAPLRPLSAPLLSNTTYFRTASVDGATTISCYSTESLSQLSLLAEQCPDSEKLDPEVFPSVPMRPFAADSDILQNNNPNDSHVDRADFPSEYLGRSKISNYPETSPKRSQRLKSRVKKALKKFSASIKPKPNISPLNVISAPELLDLPGFNRSVALGISSPIQVARFLHASETTVSSMRT
ncbi:hypothetical protein K439DRAFT_1636999 [Ramaria rubella]|nr:hypothetical protein K439DRAFT_1636999 [Ramaria rubella]